MSRKWIVSGTALLILSATAAPPKLLAVEPPQPSPFRRWWDPLNLFEARPKVPRQYLPLPRVDEGEREDGLVDRGIPRGFGTRPADPWPQRVEFALTGGTIDFMPIDYSYDEIADQP